MLTLPLPRMGKPSCRCPKCRQPDSMLASIHTGVVELASCTPRSLSVCDTVDFLDNLLTSFVGSPQVPCYVPGAGMCPRLSQKQLHQTPPPC